MARARSADCSIAWMPAEADPARPRWCRRRARRRRSCRRRRRTDRADPDVAVWPGRPATHGAARRVRGGGQRREQRRRARRRAGTAHDEVEPAIGRKLRRGSAARPAPDGALRLAGSPARAGAACRRRRLRCQPGRRSATRPSAVAASIRCSAPRARRTRPAARKPATITTACTSHSPAGSGAPPAAGRGGHAAGRRRRPRARRRRRRRAAASTSAGTRYSSCVARCLSRSCTVLPSSASVASAARRPRRTRLAGRARSAAARAPPRRQLGAARDRPHGDRARLRAQRGLEVGERRQPS